MRVTVGRTYHFRGIHSLPGHPEPWCFPHEHDYTVEVVAKGDTDTLSLDEWWGDAGFLTTTSSLPVPSTVENIARTLLDAAPPSVCAVVVWEDRQRWGKAER